jgi:hypothetical protein
LIDLGRLLILDPVEGSPVETVKTIMREIGRASLLSIALILAFAGTAMAQDQFHVIYYSDSIAPGDFKSTLFRVELNEGAAIAELTELVVLGPGAAGAGDPGWDNVDTLAVTADSKKLYFIDDGHLSNPNGRMGVYDVDTGLVTEIGLVTFSDMGTVPVGDSWIDQAAFDRDGTLYVTNTANERLYRLDPSTAFAVPVGNVVEMNTGALVNLAGADIAFGADDTFLVWANTSAPFAPRGLYRAASVANSGDVRAEFLGGAGSVFFTGMGVMLNGMGDLFVSNRVLRRFEFIDRSNGSNVLGYFTPFLEGKMFTLANGDIATAMNFAEGRMTGGGVVRLNRRQKVTHGFRLLCDATKRPNRLQVNWGKGKRFHLTRLTAAFCYDDPAISSRPPRAGFDTYRGIGTGRLNGVPGATAEWELTDAGQRGRRDILTITIKDKTGKVVLSVARRLNRGNHQAH